MKRFFSKFGLWILGSLAVIAVVFSLISVLGGSGFLRNLAGIIAYPFRTAGSTVSNWVQDIGEHFSDVDTLLEENESLRLENARLEEELRKADLASRENDSLRQALNIQQQHRDYVMELALIIDRSSSNWSSTLTLNRGTNSGISVGNCVVDPCGYLVGVVSDTGLNWCTVTTVLDTESEIGAMVFRTYEVGVATGELDLMSRNLLRLNYLPGDTGLINGDQVVTSGLGGYYPSGLVIGSVEELRTDETGANTYAVLQPKTYIPDLLNVFVITDFDVVE